MEVEGELRRDGDVEVALEHDPHPARRLAALEDLLALLERHDVHRPRERLHVVVVEAVEVFGHELHLPQVVLGDDALEQVVLHAGPAL